VRSTAGEMGSLNQVQYPTKLALRWQVSSGIGHGAAS
jgi:hypothetical protein